MIKMTKKTCIMCRKKISKYVNSYKDQGIICLDCYYGVNKNCFCEFCNKNFDIKLFDTLRNRVICPVCKRKNYIKEQGGLIHEDLSKTKNTPHKNSYFFILPAVLEKHLERLEKKYHNKSRELLIFTAISEFIHSKLKIKKEKEISELRPRNYKRETYNI